jgi:2-keto-4-pentenoate hydratase
MTHRLTTLLLAHRQAGTPIIDLPADLVPANAAEAFAIQDETVSALGPVGAWKVTPLGPEMFCSPILATDVHTDGATLNKADYRGLEIEVEIAVTIGTDLPAKAGGYTPADLKTAVSSLHVVLEILATRYPSRTAAPKLAGIADLQSNGAVVVGPAVSPADWPEFGAQALSLSFDGTEVQTSPGNSTTENVLAALAWLANNAAARNLPLKAGDVVITGARLGPKALEAGIRVTAEAPGLGTVSARFV